MFLILFLAVSGVILGLAYRWYGRILARYLGLDDRVATPAHAKRDGLDFEPASRNWLLPQHFSAIAAAGPIVGPILAGTMFGWLPAWIWIIVGAILVGGVHDLTTLVASVRHDAKSIAEVVKRYMNRRSYLLFLSFIWVSLVYVIIAFTDVTAGTFVQKGSTADAEAPGPAVATSSILYLGLAVVMGLCMRKFKLGEGKAQLIFLPLVVGAIIVGPMLPLDLGALTGAARPQVMWDHVLLVYCFFAALSPMWLLMQPRGALGGYFLYVIVIVGVLGVLVGGLSGNLSIAAPAVSSANLFSYNGATPPLLPVLFITIACGACSGFHSIVASGTTSKQLDKESDAKPVAYGGMLLESFLACISLATVMILAKPTGRPDITYADGIGIFMNQATFGLIPVEMARQFGLLCFATFVFDTLDACTRLARYVLMELTGWTSKAGMVAATVITLAGPAIVVSLPPAVVGGQEIPLWRAFWGLFGSSNQLLAALALLGVTVWLSRKGKSVWFTLGPTIFMLGMTLWSLALAVKVHLGRLKAGGVAAVHHLEFMVVVLLIVMSAWIVVEAILLTRGRQAPPADPLMPEPKAA
ncbi:MAG: carbon starvation protein A [Opitutaceae bacterium]|nr:carbon starvation protein A [Opitutaceae bacterium]